MTILRNSTLQPILVGRAIVHEWVRDIKRVELEQGTRELGLAKVGYSTRVVIRNIGQVTWWIMDGRGPMAKAFRARLTQAALRKAKGGSS